MSSQWDFILAREAQLMYKRAREFEPVNGDLGRWRGAIPGQDSLNIKFEVEISIPPEFPRQAPTVTMITPSDHPLVDPATGNLNLRILTYWRPEYHLYQVVNSIKGIFARTPPKLPDTFSSKLVPPSPQISPPAVSESLKRSRPEPADSSSSEVSQPTDETEISPPPFTSTSPMPQESPKFKELKTQVSDLEKELQTLQNTLMKKEQTIARLESRMDVHNVPKYGPNRLAEILQPQNPKDQQINDLQSEKIAVEDLMRTLEEKFENGEIGATEYALIYKSYQKELYLINEKLKELGLNS
jgi:ubiquitin-protein ligase